VQAVPIDKQASATWLFMLVEMRARTKPADDPDARSGSAHVELTPMPMVNNATARVRSAMAKAFAKVV
jgi:hypothetical protein